MTKSKIEWTDRVWNPVRGCSIVSEGCKNCYAMRQAHRFSGEGQPFEGLTKSTATGPKWNGNIRLMKTLMAEPAKWKKPSMVFVNSMSDLFHEDVPFEFISAVFSVMADINRHTYQVLTKRSERMLEFFEWKKAQHNTPWVPSDNVWLGVSVEDQKTADSRLPYLLKIPASLRFVSCEPLLGSLTLRGITPDNDSLSFTKYNWLSKIDWVIAGGESGHGARPMHPDWARSLRDQCKESDVPFFFKQWGAWIPNGQSMAEEYYEEDHFSGDPMDYYPDMDEFYREQNRWERKMDKIRKRFPDIDTNLQFYRHGKRLTGDFLDGKQHHQFPKVKGGVNVE